MQVKYFILISIPIILFSALIFYYYLDPEAILLNLATEAIFLLFVILSVDRIIERSKEEDWKGTDRLIKLRVGRLADSYIGSLSKNLDYNLDIIEMKLVREIPIKLMLN